MDSLLANYASSDEEEDSPSPSPSPSSSPPPPSNKPKPSSPPPPPKSTSFFSTLPPPKSHQHQQKATEPANPQSRLFSLLPPPKSQPTAPNPKRVVQFTLPFDPSLLKTTRINDEEDEEARKPIKDSSSLPSSKSALSSMLPAPKNSLCLAPKKTHIPNSQRIQPNQERSDLDEERTNFDPERSNFDGYGTHNGSHWAGEFQTHSENQERSGFGEYGSYGGGSSYETGGDGGGDYGGYMGNWNDGSAAVAAAMVAAPEVLELGRNAGKRGRSEVPAEIMEVNQDELMKNRPRADQVKLTGIAFGPAYQPVSSSKGKPSKLDKRKHQIGSLFYDMKQKEMELAERRAKGFLTKAETQAKYGW